MKNKKLVFEAHLIVSTFENYSNQMRSSYSEFPNALFTKRAKESSKRRRIEDIFHDTPLKATKQNDSNNDETAANV